MTDSDELIEKWSKFLSQDKREEFKKDVEEMVQQINWNNMGEDG